MDLELVRVKRIEKETELLCMDDCIATVAKYYHTGFEMMFIGGYMIWQKGHRNEFPYKYEIWLEDRRVNLERYHGLSMKQQSFMTAADAVLYIRKEIEAGRPVMAVLNSSYCPWNDGTREYDAEVKHCFLIHDVKDYDLICADPYFEKESVVLPFEQFKKGIEAIFYFSFFYNRLGLIGEEIFRPVLLDMYRGFLSHGYFSELISFCNEAKTFEGLFLRENENSDLRMEAYLVLLIKINKSIQNMAFITEYSSKRGLMPEILPVSDKLWKLAEQWIEMRKLTEKLYYDDNENEQLRHHIFSEMFRMIGELESLVKEAVGILTESVKQS